MADHEDTGATRRMRARDRDRKALLILDLLSDYRYPGGKALLPAAQVAARRIADLKKRTRRQGIPTIYVNDTRGKWESDQTSFLRRCLQGPAEAASLVERILPSPEDYFIFKPRHSAFFGTPLQELLSRLNATTLLLTGVTSHQCVLFTAVDAHVRGYRVTVARDCIAAPSAVETRHALFILEHSVDAQIIDSRYVRFPAHGSRLTQTIERSQRRGNDQRSDTKAAAKRIAARRDALARACQSE